MISYSLSDYRTYNGEYTAQQTAAALKDTFDALYEEGRRGYPKIVSYGTHPLLAHGFRIRPIEEVIRHMRRHDNVWVATREQIAEWVLENHDEMDLAEFYPNEAATSDVSYGLP